MLCVLVPRHRELGRCAHAKRIDLAVRPARGTALIAGELALPAAAESGALPEVERLLSNPATNPNVQDAFGNTALHNASRWGKTKMVEALLRAGAVVTAMNQEGQTALHCASYNGHREVVETLLRAGANMAANDNNGRTALHHAARNSHTAVVETLLRARANTAAKDRIARTALHLACGSGDKGSVEALLRAGADVAAKDYAGKTPLDLAMQNHLCMVPELVALLQGRGRR
ncbi:Death-associated protein kinase 1 [Tetrabaena socialis]|uniref:Death-associated protein kinase 1 n=1 Tax=Tetrabaena socialis TaxID=47790 RepID=A0A2J8A4X0_9CHLO|nr:Death-associated protein kinase 1 [Tetrabaena socialis]|eukprot:PNH07582.1 Death-associated protein kinase 1 [Tetrabaena socialis]